MENIKHSYELSVWELIPDEKKLVTIGSDSLDSPIKIIEPAFQRNVNGMVTLTFKMYTKYFDNDVGDFVDNPYISLLVAERVLKLKYKNKWYDLIIKNRQESSDQKMYSYTAKSLHINELSKNGFDLEFKTELENNQGTILELGEKIVEGTDWEIDRKNSDIIRAYQDDQLFICKAKSNLTIRKMLDNKDEQLTENSYFYCFYSDWKNFENGKELQGLIISNYSQENIDNYILEGQYFDADGIIISKDAWNNIISYNVLINTEKENVGYVGISNYRGRRIIKQPKTRYNSIIDKYVTIYDKGKIEGYTETEYLSPNFVQNLLVNTKDFTNTSGWYVDYEESKENKSTIELDVYPPIETSVTEEEEISSRIKFDIKEKGACVYNTGIRSNITKIDTIKENDTFILRTKFVNEDNSFQGNENFVNFSFKNLINNVSYTIKTPEIGKEEDFLQREIVFIEPISKEELKEIRFQMVFTEVGEYYLNEIELFRKIEYKKEDGTSEILYLGEIPNNGPIEKKFFYNVEENKNKKSIEEYSFLPSEGAYSLVYNDTTGYEKITSIEKSESNRFNLIQELCESFECWADFQIEHAPDGRIVSKKIVFKEYIGDIKWAGFKYGINLKSIQRTIDSDQIVTKTIVKPNSNQHGNNGFCSIEKANENPTGQNFLLNFDYYINQRLLDKQELNKDLYWDFNGYREGFYNLVKEKSNRRDEIISERLAYSTAFLEGKALLDSAKEIRDAAEKNLNKLYSEYKQYSGVGWPYIPDSSKKGEGENEEVADKKIVEFFAEIRRERKIFETATSDCEKYADYTQENYDKTLEDYDKQIEGLGLENINNAFFDKYKNFIQEGTWLSEEYWDDNLYYLDAIDVARTSSKPKITYTINVIDVSPLEGYESFEINVGDKTFIEDVDFFGYTLYYGENGDLYSKPYQEEIVVVEILEFLDSPEKNQIKVQNYKTQFDDLFQRITAQTQSLHYASGGYNRASAAFGNDGIIDGNILQQTIFSQGLVFLNPENEGVLWDKEGIKIIDKTNLNRIIKMTNGKISLTNDGGLSWTTGIDASGISAELITTGTLNTNNILIGNSNDYAFRWDKVGLNAYAMNEDNLTYNYGKFVRFDKYGLYGYSKGEYFEPTSDGDIKNNADFGLTWNGFFLKSRHKIKNEDGTYGDIDTEDLGSIEIDSLEDFRVVDSNWKTEIIKIGLLEKTDNGYNYGIRIKNSSGDSVFETSSVTGNLTITGTIKAKSLIIEGAVQNLKIGDINELDGSLKNLNSSLLDTQSSITNENLLIVSDPNIFGTLTTDEIRQEVKKYWVVGNSKDVVGTSTPSAKGQLDMLTIELNNENTEYDFILKYLGEDSYVFVNTARADVLPNTEYTFSFDGYLVDESTCRVWAYCDPKNRKDLSYNDTSHTPSPDSLNSTVLNTKNQGRWEKAKFTFTTPNDCHSVWFRIRLTPKDASSICSMRFKKLKLEKGNTATSYTLSPYDPLFQDALLSNGYVLRTDVTGKLLGSFSPQVSVEEAEDDVDSVNVIFDGSDKPYKVPKKGLIIADNMVTKGTIIASNGIFGGLEITTDEEGNTFIENKENHFKLLTVTKTGFFPSTGLLLQCWSLKMTVVMGTTQITWLGAFSCNTGDLRSTLSIGQSSGDSPIDGKIKIYSTDDGGGGLIFHRKNEQTSSVVEKFIVENSEKKYYVEVSPRFRVKVNNYGSVLLSSSSTNLNGGIYFDNSSGTHQGTIRSTAANTLEINVYKNGASGGGSGTLKGTWKLNDANIATSSDRSVKNSIELYSSKYSILFDNLNPIRYKYNNGTSNRYHTGFIAQQVEEAILNSDLTTQDFAGFVRSTETEIDLTTGEEIQVERCYLRYEEFIALNTNEIQKLKKRVTELEPHLAALLNQQN